MDKLAVLIPCYNEAMTIEKVIMDVKEVLPEAIVYVYDNNSSDNTVEIAVRAGAIVRCEKQQGKGFVVRRMFREINAQCYLLVDGDDQHPAEHGPEMCRHILDENYDMVIGDRLSTTYYQKNERAFHNWGNDFVRSAVNRLFRCSSVDVLTGYRAFSYLFVKSFPVLSDGFEIETEMTIHAFEKRLAVTSIPVSFRNRPVGSVSTLNTFRDGLRIIRTIFLLFKNYRPLEFFSFFSVILIAVAVIFFIPAINAFMHYMPVPIPTLVISGFAVMAALLCFFSGLILSTIRQKNLQDFELRLIDINGIYSNVLDKYLNSSLYHGVKN
jgi:glycosyltransferase involved in cell wall biosynthesis